MYSMGNRICIMKVFQTTTNSSGTEQQRVVSFTFYYTDIYTLWQQSPNNQPCGFKKKWPQRVTKVWYLVPLFRRT